MANESKQHLVRRAGGPDAAVASRRQKPKTKGSPLQQPLQPMQMAQGSMPVHPMALYFAMLGRPPQR